MREYGNIVVHLRDSFDEFTVEWVGPPVALVDSEALRHLGLDPYPEPGDVIFLGSSKVRVIDQLGLFSFRYEVERLDTGLRDWIYLAQHRLLRWLALINHRLLLTARVWELIEVEEGKRYEWRDLKVLKWLRSLYAPE